MQPTAILYNQHDFIEDAVFRINSKLNSQTRKTIKKLRAEYGTDINGLKNSIEDIIGTICTDIIYNGVINISYELYVEDIFDYLNTKPSWLNGILRSIYNITSDDIQQMIESDNVNEQNDASTILFEILYNSLIDSSRSPYVGKPCLFDEIIDSFVDTILQS